MEFQRERVYTALNADELHEGDKVIVADDLVTLKHCVAGDDSVDILQEVQGEEHVYRFTIQTDSGTEPFTLAYLVERKENCTNCGEGRWDAEHKKILCDPVNCGNGNVVFRNHEIEVCEYWKPKTEQKAEKHYRPFKDTDELIKVWNAKIGMPRCLQSNDALTMPYIWVRYKNLPQLKGMLINGFEDNIVYVMYTDRSMQELFDKFEFLDGSPCGVEE